jgi:hypothetical protein
MSRLTVVEPEAIRAQGCDISRARTLIGRGADADWRLDEPTVSRRHAVVHHHEDRDEIEDLGSLSGTFVNGRRVRGRVLLEPGDVLQFAAVRVRYLPDRVSETATRSVPAGESATFTVDEQRAATINNVGRDQYNQHVQQVIYEREDAMRQIASMNAVSRVLTIIGFSLAVVGVLGFIGSILVQMTQPTDMSSQQAFQDSTAPVELFGYPAFAVCMAVALVGFGLAALGSIVHMSASRHSRQLDRDHPLPPMMPG